MLKPNFFNCKHCSPLCEKGGEVINPYIKWWNLLLFGENINNFVLQFLDFTWPEFVQFNFSCMKPFKNFAFSSYWINVSSFKVRWGTRRIFQLILINCTFFYKYKDKRNQSFSRQEKNSDLHKIIYKRAVSSSHFQLLLFPS